MELRKSIDISTEQRRILLALLYEHLPDIRVCVYGSRARFSARKGSDPDMAVSASRGQNKQTGDLREAFEESDLPFRVDLFVWDAVSERFQKRVEADHVTLVLTKITKR